MTAATTPQQPEQPTLPRIDVCFAPPELGEQLAHLLFRPDNDEKRSIVDDPKGDTQ